MRRRKRTICFVTGTRAEFGLMRTTLAAIDASPSLQLRVVVTGMHLSRAHGYSIEDIRRSGVKVDAVVPWRSGDDVAAQTGDAIAGLSRAFDKINPDIVLVVGDRVEAFAAATAAHLSNRIVAHVHGGDRAAGQVDDALRHAITKLSHVHFAATRQSAERIIRLGEDRWRVHRVGTPGVDGIRTIATNRRELRSRFPIVANPFALIVLHPNDANESAERRRAESVLRAARGAMGGVVIVHPNNDPGHRGISAAWNAFQRDDTAQIIRTCAREDFLGLLRDAAVLVGNSSAGIIEAGSFGTAVIDIGDRQRGRERGPNVRHVEFDEVKIAAAIRRSIATGRRRGGNPYGGGRVGEKIAATLARLIITPTLQRKLITY